MNFNTWAHQATAFVDELAEELDEPEDFDHAAHTLKLVLQVLRNRITVEESFHLMAELPMFLKALYVDGWEHAALPDKSIRTTEDFVDAVYAANPRIALHEFPTRDSAREAAEAVFRVLKRHVSVGESLDVMAVLPVGLKRLWASA